MTNRLTIMALAPAQAEGQRRLLEGASQHAAAHRRLCLECDQRLVSRAAEVAVIPAAPPLPSCPSPSCPPADWPVWHGDTVIWPGPRSPAGPVAQRKRSRLVTGGSAAPALIAVHTAGAAARDLDRGAVPAGGPEPDRAADSRADRGQGGADGRRRRAAAAGRGGRDAPAGDLGHRLVATALATALATAFWPPPLGHRLMATTENGRGAAAPCRSCSGWCIGVSWCVLVCLGVSWCVSWCVLGVSCLGVCLGCV